MDEAVSILRKKGVATAAKKSGRSASEGVIAQSISSDRSKGILVEVNCETDFVAKNEDFVAFSTSIAGELLDNPGVDLEERELSKLRKSVRIFKFQGRNSSPFRVWPSGVLCAYRCQSCGSSFR